MRMTRNKRRFIYLFLILCASAIGLVLLPEAQAVTVGPVKFEFSADPGDTIRNEMFVQNEKDMTQIFHSSFQQFTEEDGNKVFNSEKGDIASWIEPLASVTLAPGAQKIIPFIINLPKDASPGGHFAVIWWSSSAPGKTGQQLSIVTRAGVLVYLRVSGEIHTKAGIVSFETEGNRIFFSKLPIHFNVLFKNEGNAYEKPQGTLIFYNIFGGESIKVKVNEFGSQVLPRSQKILAVEVAGDRFLLGPYRAVIDLTYGDNIHLKASKWIWLVPLKAIIWIIAIIILLICAPFCLKKYNRWIIKRHTRN